ncbi:MAG: M50 family metallopeptidase [Christensenellaceae bacterium]
MDTGNIVVTIITALLVLTLLIVVHEFGHYIAAKKRGIKVAEFAVGFGPRLIKWHRNETEFSIRPIFFGGFVKFADDEERAPQKGDFRAASLKSRILTIAAGPVMNMIVAVIISVVVLCAFGDYQPRIAEVEAGSTAYEAGLREGDIIREINGVRIDFATYDWQDYQRAAQGESLPITVLREGETQSFDVPYMDELSEEGRKVTGINIEAIPRKYNFFEAVGLSFKWLGMMIREMFSVLGRLFFMGQGVENLTGIVGTVAIVGAAAQQGLDLLLKMIAMISINLAVINLLPIPALDGGKLVMYAVEGVRKKPAPEKLEGFLNLAGFVLIMGLAVFLVVQDISRMVV